MNEKSKNRMRKIRGRMNVYRRRRERLRTAGMCALSLILVCGIGNVLKDAGLSEFMTVDAGDGTAGYGAVLLHDGANIYIMVGIAAFVAGAALTAICVKMREIERSKNARRKEEKV